MFIRKSSQSIKNITIKLGIEREVRSLLYMFGDLVNRNILIKNRSLENIYRGERCFLIATGASINDIELSKLANEFTFGCNFINYHPDIEKLYLNYFVATPSYSSLKYSQSKSVYAESKIFTEENVKVWLDNESELGKYSVNPNIYYNKIDNDLNDKTSVFINTSSKKFIEKNNYFKNKDVYYLKPCRSVVSPKDITIDLSKRITFLDSGLFSMLAIAMYMGFKEIYFIGVDYSFEPCREFHFYDELLVSKTIEKEVAIQWINKIANARKIEVYKIMEDEEYYKPIFVRYNMTKDKYKIANDFVESKGVKIFNIVPNGFESPIFRKVSWENVVKNVLSAN